MILLDFSSTIHRMIFSSVKAAQPNLIDGKFVTTEFIYLALHYILNELISISQEHKNKFGELVLCLDEPSSRNYWRTDVYAGYKLQRRVQKQDNDSEINYDDVFIYINELIDQIRNNLPWRVVGVQRAEADDVILALSREYSKYEKILIYSPDKDMIQAQKDTDSVFQYSALTKKWIKPENKNENIEEWFLEHVCLGDAADGVPRVVDGTEFSDNFIKYLKENKCDIETPYDFMKLDISKDQKQSLISNYDIYVLNRKGESTGIKDIYKKIRFGKTNLKKKIEEFGSLDKWLDSHPLYKKHYKRNYELIMEDGIPSDIWNECILNYKTEKTQYNDKEFSDYLKRNNLKSIELQLPNVFKLNRELTADDFNW